MSEKKKETKKPDLKIVKNEDYTCDNKTEATVGAGCEPAAPSTVYQLIMSRMTPEHLAGLGVQLVQVNGSELFWMTSIGQLYPFNSKKAALEAEYIWLMSTPN